MEGEGGWRRTGTQQRKDEAQEEEQRAVVEPQGEEQQHDEEDKEELLQGIASIALFPSGSLSGHFLHTASSTCLGLFGTGAWLFPEFPSWYSTQQIVVFSSPADAPSLVVVVFRSPALNLDFCRILLSQK